MVDLKRWFEWPRTLFAQGQSEGVRHFAAYQQADSGAWRSVTGEIGGERIVVRSAEEGAGDTGADGQVEAALVTVSDRALFRTLDVAEASADQTRRMVALRLEAELPYPVDESLWACERQATPDGLGGKVLVVADAKEGVSRSEAALTALGVRCTGVEFGAGSLAELARSEGREGCVALAALSEGGAVLTLTDDGALAYVRHIVLNGVSTDDTDHAWAERIAADLDQSICDYAMRGEGHAPAKLRVAGKGMHSEEVLHVLEERLGIPVAPCDTPEHVEVAQEACLNGDLLEEFPACLGALIAVHRRARGESAIVPQLKRRREAMGSIDLNGQLVRLAVANVVLAVVLVAALFGVRALQIAAADSVIQESESVHFAVDALQEEESVLRSEARRHRSVLDALLALSEVVPEEVRVEMFTLDARNQISITGKTASVEAASNKTVAAMQASSAFSDPEFLGATQEKDGFSFRITCGYRGGVGGAAK